MIVPGLTYSVKKHLLKRTRFKWVRATALHWENCRIAKTPFYRKHPFQGPLSLRAADMRTVVEPDHDLLYHRIPKNGNSSLVTSVKQIIEGRQLSDSIASKRAEKRQVRNPSELTDTEANRVPEFFKFLVARNPYDRTLSAYLSKVVAKFAKGKKGLERRIPKTLLSNGTDAPPSFEAFCEYLAAMGPYENDHWSPQVDFLIFPVESYDFIARLESIDEDFSVIASRINCNAGTTGMVPEDPIHRTGASSRRKEFYTERLYDLISDVYRRDFELLGYDPLDH